MWAKHSEAAHPELKHLLHPANGEKRDKVTAARLKGMGVKPGVPDLLLLYPKGCYIGMAIELKYAGNRPSTEQKVWLQQLRAVGYFAAVCWGQSGAIHLLEEYVKLGASQMMNEDCEALLGSSGVIELHETMPPVWWEYQLRKKKRYQPALQVTGTRTNLDWLFKALANGAGCSGCPVRNLCVEIKAEAEDVGMQPEEMETCEELLRRIIAGIEVNERNGGRV